jgi:rhodanese-related sulfurtransferase
MSNIGEPFKRIDVKQMKEMIDRGSAQIIDTRTPAEFAGGHIAGAVNIPYTAIVDRQAEIDPNKEHLLICRSGNRSAVGCEFAAACGFGDLYNIEGGMIAWTEAGFAIVKEATA